jgi:hypothetical protein
MALNDAVGKARKQCGKPALKHQLIISLPEPIPDQKDWGEVDGKALDFSNEADRVIAVKWYIDYVTEQIGKARLKNIEPAGFYWLAESASERNRALMQTVAGYIHEKKSRFYWIPYFGAKNYHDWKSFGFDEAWLQPNYFFNFDIPKSRIDEAAGLAAKYGMSLEMEFDERAQTDPKRRQRMHDYIDGFAEHGMFDRFNIAYYQGDDSLYRLFNGTDSDRALYHKIMDIIARRHRKTKN